MRTTIEQRPPLRFDNDNAKVEPFFRSSPSSIVSVASVFVVPVVEFRGLKFPKGHRVVSETAATFSVALYDGYGVRGAEDDCEFDIFLKVDGRRS
jgi:hypothetical protein